MDRVGVQREVTAVPIEQQVLGLCAQGDGHGAAEVLVRAYGLEILGFLEATLDGPALAADAFSLFGEDVWRGLPGFRGDSSLRTWAYAVARRAAWRVLRGERLRRERLAPEGAWALEVAALVRTTTQRFRRTAVKDQVRALRERLSAQERELLLLRVDRGLDWRDIARVQLSEGAPDAEVAKRAAVLRKRFERTKERLRALAAEAGLLAP